VGDFDRYEYDGAGSQDDVLVDVEWLAQVDAYAAANNLVVDQFDKKAADHLVPFTFRFGLGRYECVAGATLTVAMQKTGGSTRNDSLWIEAVDEAHRRKFEDLGLGDKELPNTGSGFLIFEFLADDLTFLQDGRLNLLIGEDEALDWATLNIVLESGQITDDR
jgi:hypothetical protein